MWYSRKYLIKITDAFYPLPSVMDARSFVGFVRSRTTKLANFLEKESLDANSNLRSKFFDLQTHDNIIKSLDYLLNLKEKDVENVVWNQNKLSDERLATCLVPYQLGANIIMNGLPKDIKKKCIEELKSEESSIANGIIKKKSNKFLQWIEKDVYVSTGLNYLRNISNYQHIRIPIIAVIGHSQHGKTTLLDALQKTNFREEESRGITQSVRALTINSFKDNSKALTFLDTPGQRIFVESRFHAQIIADYLILVVSVIEGVQSQTYEVIKVALNVDRPIIVILNKMDLFSDSHKAKEAVSKVLLNLREAGLNVTMIYREKELENLRVNQYNNKLDSKITKEYENALKLFAPMKKIDSSYKGSRKNPIVDLQRSCVGICISAKEGKNLNLLWSIIELMNLTYPLYCYSKMEDYVSHPCLLQGVILESSKHLFNEEIFRINKNIQTIQRKQDITSEKRQSRFEKNSISLRINSSLNTIQKKSQSSNSTSTNCLVLNVIVKEGCITKGVPFIADQTKGKVDYMIDSLGNPINKAIPGTAVTIIDVHSNTGCPGAGTHFLSMPSEHERDNIFEYRRLLQWYIECFPERLNLLRPRGMDISFTHLGDYGQIKDTTCLAYQLLYGPTKPESLTSSNLQLNSQNSLKDIPKLPEKSIGEYINEKNSEEKDYSTGTKGLLGGNFMLEEGYKNKIMDDDIKISLENTWKQLQPQTRPQTQEEYDELIKSCIQVGILFKVDSWHSARMLYRETVRLGTRKVAFHTIGIRFGELIVEDILFFSRAMKIVICYRTPLALSNDLDKYLEINDTWILQTDDISEVILFLKWCAVALHKEHAPDDCGVVEPSNKTYFVLMNDRSKNNSNNNDDKQNNQRQRRLLITPKSSQK